MIAKREVVLVMGIGSREEVGEEVRMKEVNDGEKETGGNDGGEVGTNEKEVGPGDRKGKKFVVDHNDDIGGRGARGGEGGFDDNGKGGSGGYGGDGRI